MQSTRILLALCVGTSLFLANKGMAGDPCSVRAKAFLETLNEDNLKPVEITDELIGSICAVEDPTVGFVRQTRGGVNELLSFKPKDDPEKMDYSHEFNLDLNGSMSAGNAKTANFGGSFGYEGDYLDHHEFDIVFKGQYQLESTDTTYELFQFGATYNYILDDAGAWSLFVIGSVARDTKKEIAFRATEIGGVMYNFFGEQKNRDLKLSYAMGHQYETLVDGASDDAGTASDFPNNSAIMSYRLKYKEKVEDYLELMAAVWFQHVFLTPGEGDNVLAWRSPSEDFRVLAEVALQVKLPKVADGLDLYLKIGSTMEYLSNTTADSNWDLVQTISLGGTFEAAHK